MAVFGLALFEEGIGGTADGAFANGAGQGVEKGVEDDIAVGVSLKLGVFREFEAGEGEAGAVGFRWGFGSPRSRG